MSLEATFEVEAGSPSAAPNPLAAWLYCLDEHVPAALGGWLMRLVFQELLEVGRAEEVGERSAGAKFLTKSFFVVAGVSVGLMASRFTELSGQSPYSLRGYKKQP